MAVVVKEGEATYMALKGIRPHQTGLLRTITAVDCYVGTTRNTDTQVYPVLDGVGSMLARLGYAFSGTIEDGEPSGQGILRWYDGRTVEGNFIHGMVDGTGKLQWPNGDIYTGSLYRSVRHGSGCFISDSGASRYEGNWKDGMRHGTGVQQYANGSLYSGQWVRNARHGRGTLRYQTGDVYEGEWDADVPSGHGVMGWVDASQAFYKELYVGEWRGGKPEGAGQSTYVSLSRQSATPVDTVMPLPVPSLFLAPAEARLNVYVGEYRNGLREGPGTFYYADGSCYQGQWKAGAKSGVGFFTSAVGEVREEENGSSGTAAAADKAADALATVPVVSAQGLSNLLESADDLRPTLDRLLQRYNTTLKCLFQHCCRLREAVALPSTPHDWWQQRLPGRVTLIQCLALLHSAHVIGAAFTIGDALRTAATVVNIETTSLETSVLSATGRPPASLSSSVDDINQAGGVLNYRQFCEWLIRVAAQVEKGPESITVSDQLSALLDGPLRVATASVSTAAAGSASSLALASVFLPHSLAHATDVQVHLSALRKCYKELRSVCEDASCSDNGAVGVPLRCVLTAMHRTLTLHRITPASVVKALAWLKDGPQMPAQGSAAAPSLSLAQELKILAMAKNRVVQQSDENTEAVQSFVEFVETIMTIADLAYRSDGIELTVLLEELQRGLFAD